MLYQHYLDIVGLACVPEASPMNIPVGWSIIGYLRQSPASIETMLSSIVSNIIIVKNGAGAVYWPFYTVNGIGNMNPGEGYQVKLTIAQVFFYPPNGPAQTAKLDQSINTLHYTGLLNTGNNMTVGVPLSAWAILPQTGDELGIFNTRAELIGSNVYIGKTIAVTVWGDDVVTTDETEGITDGEMYTFRLWNHITGEEQQLIVESWSEGNEYFESNAIAVVEKFLAPVTVTDNFILFQNIPNPFSNSTEIKFYLPVHSNAKLEIFNVLGELMEVLVSDELDKGTYTVNFGGINYISGVYFYRLTTDTYTATKTMNIIR
jgi:hypothetical protein